MKCTDSDVVRVLMTRIARDKIQPNAETLAACAEIERGGLKRFDSVEALVDDLHEEKALPFDIRVPNALTEETLAKSDRGEDVYHAKDANDLFGQLDI